QWGNWVATQLAQIQENSQIYVPFGDVTGARSIANQIAFGGADRSRLGPESGRCRHGERSCENGSQADAPRPNRRRLCYRAWSPGAEPARSGAAHHLARLEHPQDQLELVPDKKNVRDFELLSVGACGLHKQVARAEAEQPVAEHVAAPLRDD